MNMEDIVVIDLTKFNTLSLERVIKESKIEGIISLNDILKMKSDGLAKIFIHKTSGIMFGFTTKKQRGNFQLTEVGISLFLSIEPFVLPKFVKEEDDQELSLDIILDKISNLGRSSLTEREINFLENYSKYK
jgi:hypothetical protein